MALQDIVVPQMGEGLQEVSVVAFHKKPGEFVKRDEPLYSMETDKAVVDVESPFAGTLAEWLAAEGDRLTIGAPIARIETAAAAPAESKPEEQGDVQIPPRTRAHAKEHGIGDEEMRRIPAKSGKLMPADVDDYLAAKAGSGGAAQSGGEYVARPLSDHQRALVRRLRSSAQVVIPATMKRPARWDAIARLVEERRAQSENGPTEFQTFAFCVAQAVKDHPQFRSTLPGEDTAHEYPHVNLGIAVARENNDLVTAVVPDADTLNFEDFIRTARERIKAAREGHDQASASTQLLLTYMGAYGVMDATPVLVAPAIAILFIGATYEQSGEKWVNVSLTFDHRLINGVEAAQFVNAVIENAENIDIVE